jgi:flagellar motor component MotA
MALAAILAIQAGDNPRIVAQKLQTFAPAAAAAEPAKDAASADAPARSEEAA